MPRVRRVNAVLAVLATATFGMTSARADNPLPPADTLQHFNAVEGASAADGNGTLGESAVKNPPNPICTTVSSSAANVNTDCEAIPGPHNETTIAVNPTNPLNLLAGANDYQLRLSNGGGINETIYSRADASFDGGRTWRTAALQQTAYIATGDPAIAFDAAGRAYYATLGFGFSQGRFCCLNPDIIAATSTDGGAHWTAPLRVASGSGVFGSPGTFNDKEYVAAWGNGNAIVTWTVFNDGFKGATINSPIFASVTHDGGASWSAGVAISGSAAFCVGSQGGNACDRDQFSVPTVAADGSIYVAFENEANFTTGRDQYLVVKVDPATGQRIAGPFQVAGLIDGFTDYPINVSGSQTYHDSEFRSNSAGNITADLTNAAHLAVVWSDMRNSTLPAPRDPFAASTNSDVVVSQSFDGGAHWGTPTALASPGDQFQPWAAYDTGGRLRIGFYDRSYDAANHMYGYTLATETGSGTLTFSTSQLTTTLSDPTQGTRWFSGGVVNHASTFIGDYSGIAATPSGGMVALWTDLRESVCFTVRCGTGENAFFAAHS